MQLSLFLVLLLSQCCFVMCQPYKYHFIQCKKNWTEAQAFCRRNYTDLATVYNMKAVERLNLNSTNNEEEAWIGLKQNAEMTWHWSLPGLKYNKSEEQWSEGQPAACLKKNCVAMNNDSWTAFPCKTKRHFICYDEGNQSYPFINVNKSWLEARTYCRKHHTDLVSGSDHVKRAQGNSSISTNVWSGLFRDDWKWSDKANFSFRNWDDRLNEKTKKECAVAKLNRYGNWSSDNCTEKKPFFCYEGESRSGFPAQYLNPYPVKIFLIQQNMTWVEALLHCRKNYDDLVFITSREEQMWVQEKAKNASTSHVWLGLHYSCVLDYWFWVSDKPVTYENWASGNQEDDCKMSGAMEMGGKWVKRSNDDKFNFICTCSKPL